MSDDILDSDILQTARKAVDLAKKHGAKEVAASSYRSRQVELIWRDGKAEKVSEATTRGVSLQLYVNGRYGTMFSSDLRPAALERTVEDAIALTKTLGEDPFRALPDPKLYANQPKDDLRIRDGRYDTVTPADREKLARRLEEGARSSSEGGAKKDRILSVASQVSDSSDMSARVHSNGFEGVHEETSFWISSEVSIKDDDGRKPEDYFAAGGHFLDDLPPAEGVGQQASDRAYARLGAKKVASAVMPMIVEARASGGLLRHLIGALSAGSIQQKRSFLEGKIGETIGSKLLTIMDDPLLPKGLASRRYDGEGIAAKKTPIFDKGVLKNFYVDVYYGKKLKMDPTTGRSSNLVLPPGTKDVAGLLADIKDGFLIAGFLGGNSNSTTGDFSLGVHGFRVENGKKAEPISEMNISGNHLKLWTQLRAVGNDPYPYASSRIPSLVFDGVQFAGT